MVRTLDSPSKKRSFVVADGEGELKNIRSAIRSPSGLGSVSFFRCSVKGKPPDGGAAFDLIHRLGSGNLKISYRKNFVGFPTGQLLTFPVPFVENK